jgi:hypothetical protein
MALNLQVENVVSATAQTVKDQNGNTSPLTLSTDKVGIGTAAPISKLHILSAASDRPPRLQSSPGGTGSFAAGLDFYSGETGKGYVGVPDASAGFGAGELLLFGGPGTKTSLWAGSNRSVTLDTNGNVGIGTSEPGAKLDVAGELQVLSEFLSEPNTLHFTSVWRGWPSARRGHAEISNDIGEHKALMIVGNYSADTSVRRVALWDRLEINGFLGVTGDVEVRGDVHLISHGITVSSLLARIQELERRVNLLEQKVSTGSGRQISVTKEGAGSTTVFVVNGSGFTPNSTIIIKITDPNFKELQFPETVGADGRFVSRHSVPCVSGIRLIFTSFEDANPTHTFSNVVVTTCP